ncbi:MAG: 30S ribosomal protein S7 [Planctomycetota bacterium]
MALKKWTKSAQSLRPDPRYASALVSKFINTMMWDGKKAVSQRTFYQTMQLVEDRIKDTPALTIFETAVNNVKPHVEVRSKRVGGATYQVPMSVGPKRQQALAFRWIIQAARARKGKAMSYRLADELVAAYNREGAAHTQRENVHKMADANKAFAHFAW